MFPRMLLVAALVMVGSVGRAEIVATCGASEGWAYYVPGGLAPAGKPEWVKDQISSGSFQLIRSGEDFDIVFTDATGRTLSAKGDGGSIVGFATKDGNVVVYILYEMLTENYVFWLSQKQPTLSYSQAKFATPIRKHSLLVAPCRRGK